MVVETLMVGYRALHHKGHKASADKHFSSSFYLFLSLHLHLICHNYYNWEKNMFSSILVSNLKFEMNVHRTCSKMVVDTLIVEHFGVLFKGHKPSFTLGRQWKYSQEIIMSVDKTIIPQNVPGKQFFFANCLNLVPTDAYYLCIFLDFYP